MDQNNSNHINTTETVLGIYLRSGGADIRRINGNETECFSVEVDPSFHEQSKILEEVVYATPSLLGDFIRTDIVIDSSRYAFMPSEVAEDSQLLADTAHLLWRDIDTETLTVNPTVFGATAVSSFDAGLSGFANRTFSNPKLIHRIASLTTFFGSLSHPVNQMKLYAHFADKNRLDIVAMTGDRLLMANSFECLEASDAVYFIMAAVKDCGFDQLEDELLVCGDASRCSEVSEELRRYVNSVMPLLLPASALNSPLELQIVDL